MRWPMSFKHENCAKARRSLVYRPGMADKPRYSLVLAARTDARLAQASVVLITTQFEDTPYEVTLPRVQLVAGAKLHQCSEHPAGDVHRVRPQSSWKVRCWRDKRSGSRAQT